MKKTHELPNSELPKRRENARILMATLAALFFAYLIVIYITGKVSLGYLGFVFLFFAILKYQDMRYYDTIIRINELKEKQQEDEKEWY